MFKCTTCYRVHPTWKQLSRHIRDRHDTQPMRCINYKIGCPVDMARSRRSALTAHELRCKYHSGSKKNPKIYGSSAKKERENTHHKDATPTKDERKKTPSPLKCIKEMRAPELLSQLHKTPEKKNVEKVAADHKTDEKKESAEK